MKPLTVEEIDYIKELFLEEESEPKKDKDDSYKKSVPYQSVMLKPCTLNVSFDLTLRHP